MVPSGTAGYIKQNTDDVSIFRVLFAGRQRCKVCPEGGVREVIRSSKSKGVYPFNVLCKYLDDLPVRS